MLLGTSTGSINILQKGPLTLGLRLPPLYAVPQSGRVCAPIGVHRAVTRVYLCSHT